MSEVTKQLKAAIKKGVLKRQDTVLPEMRSVGRTSYGESRSAPKPHTQRRGTKKNPNDQRIALKKGVQKDSSKFQGKATKGQAARIKALVKGAGTKPPSSSAKKKKSKFDAQGVNKKKYKKKMQKRGYRRS